MVLCEKCNCEIKKTTPKTKTKRKPSAYNKHIGKEMKAGKSMADAAASWKAKNEKKKK